MNGIGIRTEFSFVQGMPCRALFLPKLDLLISLDPSLESALSYSHWK